MKRLSLRLLSLCLVLSLFAGLACVLSSCASKTTGPPEAPAGAPTGPAPVATATGQIRVGIVTNAVSAFWNPMTKGMEAAAEKLGVDAKWEGPQDGQVATQRRLIENFAAQKVDAICISPITEEAIKPVIDDLVAKGIVVILFDSDVAGSKRAAYIGTNNFKAGQELGMEALKVVGKKPTKAVAFVGTMTASNAKERLNGFKDATKGIIEVVDVREDQTDKNRARKNVEEVLASKPDVTLLVGLWSYNAPAIAQAVQAASKADKVKIVSFDAEPATLEHLAKGEIEATVVQKPFFFGYLAVQLMRDMVEAGVEETQMMLPPGGVIDTGVTVVTPKTVEEFKKYLTSIGVESS